MLLVKLNPEMSIQFKKNHQPNKCAVYSCLSRLWIVPSSSCLIHHVLKHAGFYDNLRRGFSFFDKLTNKDSVVQKPIANTGFLSYSLRSAKVVRTGLCNAVRRFSSVVGTYHGAPILMLASELAGSAKNLIKQAR